MNYIKISKIHEIDETTNNHCVFQGKILNLCKEIKITRTNTPYIWFIITDFSKVCGFEKNVIKVYVFGDIVKKYHTEIEKDKIYDIINPYISKSKSGIYRLQLKNYSKMKLKKHLNVIKSGYLCIQENINNNKNKKKILFSNKKTKQVSIKHYFK